MLEPQPKKHTNNYLTLLQLMSLSFNNKNINISTSLLFLWLQSSIVFSINISWWLTYLSPLTSPFLQFHESNVPSPNSYRPTKHFPKNLNQAPCTICYIENMTTLPEGTTIDTTHFQRGELIHMDFVFYNVTSIRGFNSILTVNCSKTISLWISPDASRQDHIHIIRFILTTLKNEQHSCKRVRVDQDGAFGKTNRCSQYSCWLLQHLYVNYWLWSIMAQWKIKDRTYSFTTWLEQALFTVNIMTKNCDVEKKHHKKSIDAISIVN